MKLNRRSYLLVVLLLTIETACGGPVRGSSTPYDFSRPPHLIALVSIEGFSRQPVWSPASSEVAFAYSSDNPVYTKAVFRVSVSGGGPVPVIQDEEADFIRDVRWSPRGDWIAFNEAKGPASGIYVVRPNGEDLTRLFPEAADPIWSPDGQSIAFASDEVHLVHLDSTSETWLVTDLPVHQPYDTHLAWSPDSARIAFTSEEDGNLEIYGIGADGSQEINLTNNPARDSAPDWSPDGSKIAFISDRDGSRRVYTMAPDGSNQTVITPRKVAWGPPLWSPDGHKIAFEEKSGNLVVMNADGTGSRVVANEAYCEIGDYSWSPDGKQIAFSCAYTHDITAAGGDLPMDSASWIYLVHVSP